MGQLLLGFRMWGSSPRLMLLGLVPALIVGVVFLGLLAGIVVALPGLSAAIVPFADDWVEPLRAAVRVLAGSAILLLAVVLLLLGYSAVTLTVGDPCYERISRRVEQRLGNAPPEREEPLLQGVLRALRDGARLLLAGLLLAVVAFAIGFVPLVGAVLATLLSVTVGGWLLAVELTGTAFDVRGFDPEDRRRALRTRRPLVLGFGMITYVLFLLPFVAVFAMPAAVAGAAVLTRTVLEE